MTSRKHYITYHNGGSPFLVATEAQDDITEVDVYPAIEDQPDGTRQWSTHSMLHFQSKKMFLGLDPLDADSEYNSLLFAGVSFSDTVTKSFSSPLLDGEKYFYYIFIGATVELLQTANEIVDFQSPVGNSAVMHPAVKDNQNHWFLVYEGVLIDSHTKGATAWHKFHNLNFAERRRARLRNHSLIAEWRRLEHGSWVTRA